MIGNSRCQLMVAMALCVLLVACGGGGGGGGPSPGGNGDSNGAGGSGSSALPPSSVASAAAMASGSPALITLASDAGDYVGQGQSYAYDTSNASIQLKTRGSHLSVVVNGKQSWMAEFQLPGNLSGLQPGTYTGLTRYPFQTTGAGALSWTGQGRGCNTLTGQIIINAASYSSGVLQSLDMSFEQHCDGAGQALRGQIRVDPATMSRVMAPRNPLPANAVVSLASDSGDYIGGGATFAYDQASAQITVQNTGTHLSIHVLGDDNWYGDFALPGDMGQWQPGTYTGLTRYPFNSTTTGGLSWWGNGAGCNTLNGQMTVNSVRYDAGVLAAINLDFEQHCEGAPAALHGHIDWDASRPAPAPEPAPMPAGLWTPAQGQMAASGNAMYLTSDYGDYIGQGWTYWVSSSAETGPPAGTPTDTKGSVTVAVTEVSGLLTISLTGTVNWSGQFKAMDGLAHLKPGYYGVVQRYPFHNPQLGGMSWSMDSRGCNQLSGWFAVDSITYSGDTLTSVDLRFVQYCENGISALRGKVRWNLGNKTN